MRVEAALYKGDTLEVMSKFADRSIDMILCDLPYGTTACKWDTVIPFEPLWEQYKRIIKPNGAIVLFSNSHFTIELAHSNMHGFCYSWVWDKKFAANFVQANRMPLRTHEDVCVFSVDGKMPQCFPQKTLRDVPIKKGGNKQSAAIPIRQTEAALAFGGQSKIYDDKHPESIVRFSSRDEARGLHPTQKPVALCEYLVKTYTNESALVLDNTMGSGTTGVACMHTKRYFAGVERDDKYFAIAEQRIDAAPWGIE